MNQGDVTNAKTEQQQPKRSPAEWFTFTAASFILAAIVSLVGYTWVKDNDKPPVISISNKQPIQEVDGKFYLPFEVVNTGGQTAESVQIIAELEIEGVAETGEQQIDFLSPDEKEEGAFIFSKNPQQGQLTLRVASYKLP